MQNLIVFGVGVVAALYATWYWLPKSLRQALARRLQARAPAIAAAVGQTPGCSNCETCGQCAGLPSDTAVTAVRPVQMPQSGYRPN